MKSPVLRTDAMFAEWCMTNSTFGDMKPTHYPCIIVADSQGTLQTIIYYSEFQEARYEMVGPTHGP